MTFFSAISAEKNGMSIFCAKTAQKMVCRFHTHNFSLSIFNINTKFVKRLAHIFFCGLHQLAPGLLHRCWTTTSLLLCWDSSSSPLFYRDSSSSPLFYRDSSSSPLFYWDSSSSLLLCLHRDGGGMPLRLHISSHWVASG